MNHLLIIGNSLNAPIGQEEGELRQVEHCLLIQIIYPFFLLIGLMMMNLWTIWKFKHDKQKLHL